MRLPNSTRVSVSTIMNISIGVHKGTSVYITRAIRSAAIDSSRHYGSCGFSMHYPISTKLHPVTRFNTGYSTFPEDSRTPNRPVSGLIIYGTAHDRRILCRALDRSWLCNHFSAVCSSSRVSPGSQVPCCRYFLCVGSWFDLYSNDNSRELLMRAAHGCC